MNQIAELVSRLIVGAETVGHLGGRGDDGAGEGDKVVGYRWQVDR